MTQYHFDERGHLRSDSGQTELSDDEICHRLSEYQILTNQVAALKHELLKTETLAQEQLSAYKKRMRPRLDDAERFVALAIAFVTQDPQFAALCDNAMLHPTSVDDVRAAVDKAREVNRKYQ